LAAGSLVLALALSSSFPAAHDTSAGALQGGDDGTPPVAPPNGAPAANQDAEIVGLSAGSPNSRSSSTHPRSSPAGLTYDNASKGFLTDGAWMVQFGLARIDGSGFPTVVTMRGHDDILCKTQGWHTFRFDGQSIWSHSEWQTNYGYGGYNVGLLESNSWVFGSGAHHTSNQNFHVVSAGGGDLSNGLATPEPMYWGYAPAFGDFDSNGIVDMVANANPWSGSNTTSTTFVWRGPAGKWSLDQLIDKQWNVHYGMKFVDFDRDGFLDLASSNDILREPGHFIWRYNNENGRFEPWTNDLDEAMRSEPFDVGDLNSDGLPDVVLVRKYKQGQDWKSDLEAHLQVPDAPGKFTESSSGLPEKTDVSHLRLYDMDGDGDLDIAATETIPMGQWYTSRLAVWLNDGSAQWTPAPVSIQGEILAPADWLEVDDIDNNGRGDFVFPENWGDCSEGGGFRAYKEDTPVASTEVWVDEPWGGERWYPGSIRYLGWRSAFPGTSGCGGSTTLEYSVSGPSGAWKKIDDQLACSGTYAWKVPNDPSPNVFVRATVKSSKGNAVGLSARGTVPFEIIGGSAIPLRASVTAPAGGETWDVATTQKVSWTVSGGQAPHSFDLEYSASGPSGPWKRVATGLAATDHPWTIPDDPSTTAVVRVIAKDSSSPQQSAVALSKEFTIRRPLIAMQATLRADPRAVGSGDSSTIILELKDPTGAGIAGATISLSADNGASVSTAVEKPVGLYEATLTAPTVASKTPVTVSSNASKAGFTDSAATVQVEVSPYLPDLRVEAGKVRVDGDALDGSRIAVRAVISNAGPSPAGEFRVAYLVDGKESGSESVSGLAVRETRDVSWEWTAVKGKHVLRIVLDPDAKVKESDESNNEGSAAVEVVSPPRAFEIPWWLLLLIAAMAAGLAVAAAASRSRKRPCQWCGARHPQGAPCLSRQEGSRW
jgi:hypothetical protein